MSSTPLTSPAKDPNVGTPATATQSPSMLSGVSFAFGFNNKEFGDVELLITPPKNGLRRKRPTESLFVNKFFLSAQSDYFRQLFSGGMLEPSQKSVEIVVENELQPFFIDMIYAVFHNGEFQTSKTATDLLSVLRLCNQYLMSSVVVACNERLQHSILTFDDAQAYFAMVESTPNIMNEAVVKIAGDVLVQHFGVIDRILSGIGGSDLLDQLVNLSPLAMCELCKSSALRVVSEATVFLMLTLWSDNHDENALEDMLMNVRYDQIDQSYMLEVVLEHPLIKKSAKLSHLIAKSAYCKMERLDLTSPRDRVLAVDYNFTIAKSNTTGKFQVVGDRIASFDGEMFNFRVNTAGNFIVSLQIAKDGPRRSCPVAFTVKVRKLDMSWQTIVTPKVTRSVSSKAAVLQPLNPIEWDYPLDVDDRMHLKVTIHSKRMNPTPISKK